MATARFFESPAAGPAWDIRIGMMMNRRRAISLALGGLAGSQGCRPRDSGTEADPPEPAPPAVTAPAAPREGESLVPVSVERSLKIRTLTGLRPFRPSGFVVRRDEIGGKAVIHNYGHGGGGITLSWGSAHLAVRLAGEVAGTSCAVIGGGVMGLSTAHLLQLRGASVTLYTRDLPPDTTSNVAGAQWWPVSVFDGRRRTPAFAEQYVEAANFSYEYFQRLVGPRWGVRWIPNYYLSQNPPSNGWMGGPGGVLHHLQIGFRDFGPGEHAFPSAYARRFHTMLIEPSTYLPTLLGEVRAAGARIEIRDFGHATELLQLPDPTIFNCTGLGARSLFGDEELIPVRGQLEVLLPQPAVNYNLITDAFYMFPRSDGVILGGTFDRGNWDLAANPATTEFILNGNRAAFEGLRNNQNSHR